MKKIFLSSALAMVFLNAHAESNHCKLSDFNGDWVGFQAEILTIPGTPPNIPPTYPHTGACTFTVSDGTIDDGTCELTVPNPAAVPPTFIYPTPHFNGAVEVELDCSATFTFNFPVRGTGPTTKSAGPDRENICWALGSCEWGWGTNRASGTNKWCQKAKVKPAFP